MARKAKNTPITPITLYDDDDDDGPPPLVPTHDWEAPVHQLQPFDHFDFSLFNLRCAGPRDGRQAGQGLHTPPAVADPLPAFDPRADVDTRLQVIRAAVLQGPQTFTSPSEAARAETRTMKVAGCTVQAIRPYLGPWPRCQNNR